MIQVDLNAKILGKDHNVFFARPGKAYRLYDLVVEHRTVLVDLPALDFELNLPLAEQAQINRRIHRSRALKNWYLDPDAPRDFDRNLASYSESTEDAGTTQLRGILSGFFERARHGDLVMVAPRSYSNLVYIGEFAAEPGNYAVVSNPRIYGGEPLLGRSVEWLAKIEKRWLPEDIIEIVHKPNAFVQLPRSSYKWFYNLAYSSYQIGDEFRGRFDVVSTDFASYDDLLIQSFFNFVAVNTRVLDEQGGDKLLSIFETTFVNAEAYGPELQTQISSPGFLGLSAAKITPLVASALFAIAVSVSPADAVRAAEDGTLRIGNASAPANDPCVALVEKLSINQIKLHGLEGWAAACEKAKEAQRRTGMTGPARVTRKESK